jgi:hypothetical protein
MTASFLVVFVTNFMSHLSVKLAHPLFILEVPGSNRGIFMGFLSAFRLRRAPENLPLQLPSMSSKLITHVHLAFRRYKTNEDEKELLNKRSNQ